MEYVNALMLLVGMAALLIFVYGPWQTICVDWARNTMFEARDEIFDLAMQGYIDHRSSEYREIRNGLNRLIRFAHMISWPTLLLIYTTITIPESKPGMVTALDRISHEPARRKIKVQIKKAFKAVILLLFLRSPVLWIVLAIGLLLRHLTRNFDHFAHSIAERIQTEADQYEEDDRQKPTGNAHAAHL